MIVSPTNPLMFVPNATEIQAAITYTAANGQAYVVDIQADTDDKEFSTRSSAEFLREKESFAIYLEERVAVENFVDIQTILQTEFRKRRVI